MTREIKRRRFLRDALTAAGSLATLPALHGLGLISLQGCATPPRRMNGYGPLHPVADLRDGVERISLPEGFQYRTFSPAGARLSDGHRVPLGHDGMGLFRDDGRGRFRLVRNHEDRSDPGEGSTWAAPGAYDATGGGGTTTLVVNPFTRELERDFISCSGTIVNCAGGITPWRSWVTCEETNAGVAAGWGAQHGYCFDVPADADAPVEAVALKAMGRFSHEAICVDPATGIVYETEDNGRDSGFYRFIPETPARLVDGGTLEMLAIVDRPAFDTRTGQAVGASYAIGWVPIPEPDPVHTGNSDVFTQGHSAGGARFARLEGCWFADGAVYFNATSGGDAECGQVWELRPDGDGGTLRLVFESPGANVLDAPDNLVVSPQGALLVCEDSGTSPFMRGITVDGEIFDFARNIQNGMEWAGATFGIADPAWNDPAIRGDDPVLGESLSERVTLFVNRQGATSGPNPPREGREGLTFAIWGPWDAGAF